MDDPAEPGAGWEGVGCATKQLAGRVLLPGGGSRDLADIPAREIATTVRDLLVEAAMAQMAQQAVRDGTADTQLWRPRQLVLDGSGMLHQGALGLLRDLASRGLAMGGLVLDDEGGVDMAGLVSGLAQSIVNVRRDPAAATYVHVPAGNEQ